MKSNIALLITRALFLFCYQAFSYANEIVITFYRGSELTQQQIKDLILKFLRG
ncbi:MAG: hypothetical protein H0T84_14260 [Tatlockia sp.]|nr:hypothetical protein [Tatlockia sp.]